MSGIPLTSASTRTIHTHFPYHTLLVNSTSVAKSTGMAVLENWNEWVRNKLDLTAYYICSHCCRGIVDRHSWGHVYLKCVIILNLLKFYFQILLLVIQWEQPLTHLFASQLHTKLTHVKSEYHEPSNLSTSAATTIQISLASLLVVSRQKPVQAPLQALLQELPQYLDTKIIVMFISIIKKGFVMPQAH